MTRSFGLFILVLVLIAMPAAPASAQKANAQTATHASAEIVKGKLNPADSKPGDEITVRLKEDVRSNGQVILKKGSTITGRIKNAQRMKGQPSIKGQAQSMMEIQWLLPQAQGSASQQVMIAVQSLTYTNPLFAHSQSASADSGFDMSSRSSAGMAAPAPAAGSILGGVASVGSTVTSTVTSTVSSTTQAETQGTTNLAVLSMPTVIAADSNTSAALQSSFGMSGDQKLFKTGRGEVINAAGSKQSVDLFSHLSNDTVLTSQSNEFEISSGAQMQLLVGVQK